MTSLASATRRHLRGSASGLPLLVASGLALALSACSHVDRQEIVGSVPQDYRLAHPIAIEDSVKTMDIPVSLNSARLSEGFKANIQGFAQGFRRSGAAVIAIVTPSGSADERAATWLSFQIQDTLVASGVSAKQIDFRVYRAGPGERSAPVRIAYSAISAHTAPCGSWPDQVGNTEKNGNYYDCKEGHSGVRTADTGVTLCEPAGPGKSLQPITNPLFPKAKGAIYASRILEFSMDVSSASQVAGLQAQQLVSASQLQALERQMQQELALIEAMAGAAPTVAAPPQGVGTIVDVHA